MTCLNCSARTLGPYCHECGRKNEFRRYTIKGLFEDLFFSLFNLEDKGLANTVRSLTTEPGKRIRAVINGHRTSLYPPFQYLALIGAVVIILSLRYRFFDNEYTHVESNHIYILSDWIFIPKEHQTFVENFFNFAEDNATLLNVAAIPIFAFFSYAWLSGGKYNFAENLVVNTFITAQQLFFLLLLVPFFEFLPGHKTVLITIYSLVIITYNIWVYLQFFGTSFNTLVGSVAVVMIAYLYQFPLNFLIFYMHERFLKNLIQWIPEA